MVSRIIVLKNNHVKSEFTGRITLALAEVCATARFQIWKFNRIKDPAPPPPTPHHGHHHQQQPSPLLPPLIQQEAWQDLLHSPNSGLSERLYESPLGCGPVGSVPFDFSPNVRHLKKKKKPQPLTPHRNSWCYSTDPGVTPPPWPFRAARVL